MPTVPCIQATQSLRRVSYLCGGPAAHATPPMPRHAWPALFLPLPHGDSLAVNGCATH